MSANTKQNAPAPIAWDYPRPHTITVEVQAADIDVMGHTNNVVYLRWLEQAAWEHSCAVGMGWDTYRKFNRAMVARRHELEYLAATFEGERIVVGTWITPPGRLGMKRLYQLVREHDTRTVMRASTDWVCINLASGRPCRMPPEYVEAYRGTV